MMAALVICQKMKKSSVCVGRLLESDVGVGDQEGAEDGVHDGVERAGGEGSNGERDQTHADSPEETLVSPCSIYTEIA